MPQRIADGGLPGTLYLVHYGYGQRDKMQGKGGTVTPKLTVKQAGFRDDLATCTQRQAYINNYNTYGMSAAVIDVEASRLAANPKISLSVIAAQENQRDWTLATVLQDCDTNLVCG